ncbi:ABC transporter permease [Clostridiaceae bacterium 14S0207]|nr:ABC transporter permease [Clostridiaceae bacterium 14S0207]
MNNYTQLTFKYLKQNKKRTILTIVGIILAISLFSGIGTFMFSVQDSLIEKRKQDAGNWEFGFSNLNKERVYTLANSFEIKNYSISKEEKDIKIKNNQNVEIDFSNDDKKSFNEFFKVKSLEGKVPNKSKEIIISKNAKRVLKKELEDSIELGKDGQFELYKIVGFDKELVAGNSIKVRSYCDFSKLEEGEKYDVVVNLKAKKDKVDIAEKIAKKLNVKVNPSQQEVKKIPCMISNNWLLSLEGQGVNQLLNTSLTKMLIIIVCIIVVCTVAVIYNSFNISVAERINQFGILRSIGATPRKIRKLVLQEACFMGLISIPLGIIAGYLGIYITIYILSKSKFSIFDNLINVGLYPEVILISSALGIITILLSVIGPARTASKISPIDAIRNSGNIKKEKYKKRRTFLIKAIFRVEGDVAYKNIRRNNKRFIITLFSLIISLVMFDVFTASSKQIRMAYEQTLQTMDFDAGITCMNHRKSIDPKFIEELKGRKEIKDVFTPINYQESLAIESKFINQDLFTKVKLDKADEVNINNNKYVNISQINYCSYDKSSLEEAKKYLIEGSVDEEKLNNGGVLIIDTNKLQSKENNKVVIRTLNCKVGDEIKIPKMKNMFRGDDSNKNISLSIGTTEMDKRTKKAIKENDFIKVKVVGILSKDMFNGISTRPQVSMVFGDKNFKDNFGQEQNKTVALRYKDENSREKIQEYLTKRCEEQELNCMDVYLISKQVESVQTQVAVFIFGFITIITFICIVNIINTITIGLLLRKSEFATLMSIGMTKKQLTKMVMLEGILHGIIVSIIGTAISYGLFKLMMTAQSQYIEVSTNAPIDMFIIGALGCVLITLIASLIPLKKLKKMSIVENIRARE